MPPKQSQKQKQTVIVNIGSSVVKKRKRKPRKKKASGGSSRMPPPPPPPPTPFNDLRQVLYPPQPPMRADDNLAVQLNSVTKQLQDLQDKQQNRTANLMAGARAIAREEGAQGSVMEETEMPLAEPKAKAKRKAKLRVVEQPEPVASPRPVSQPELPASLSPEPSVRRGRSGERDEPRQPKLNKDGTPRKPRIDKKGPGSRGSSAGDAKKALLAGKKMVAVDLSPIPGGNTPAYPDEATSTLGGMVFN
jgi:hypothetical protein